MRLVSILLIFLGLAQGIGILGQNSDIDSLIQVARLTNKSKEKCELYNRIAWRLVYTQPQKAIFFTDKALQLSITNDYENCQAEAFFIQGIIYQMQNKYKEATDKLFSSLILEKKLKNQFATADIYHRLGRICKITGNFDQALEYSLNSLKLAKEQNDTLMILGDYNTLGSIYKYMGDYEQAFIYYNKCIDILENITGRDEILSGIYNNIGIVYGRLQRYQEALKFYNKSLDISIKLKDTLGFSNTYGNIAEILLKEKKLDSAYIYLKKSFNFYNTQQDKRILINLYLNFADYYYKIKNYEEALEYTNKAIKMAQKFDTPLYVKTGYELLKDIYIAQNNYKEALEYQTKYMQLNDSLFNIEKYARIAQLEALYKNEVKEVKQDVEKQKKRLISFGVLGVLAFSLIILFFIYYNLRLKFKKNKLNKIKLEVEKEKLLSELSNNNRDLTRNLIYLTEKNELINDLKRKLQDLKSNLKVENKAMVQSIINEMNASTNNKIWEEFEVRFNNVHKDFYDRFYSNHPDLTQNEKRLVAFLKLGMSTKEISMITKQSVHSIGVARTRLRKKLGLSNTDINIYSYLDQF